jgi:hypothetical protein
MKAVKYSSPNPVSLQELFENETRISQRLLIEMAAAQSELAKARGNLERVQAQPKRRVEAAQEVFELIQSEIEGRLVLGQPIEPGPLTVERTRSGAIAMEVSERQTRRAVREVGDAGPWDEIEAIPF